MSVYTDIDVCCRLDSDISLEIIEEFKYWLGLVNLSERDMLKFHFGTFDEYAHSYPGAVQRSLASNSHSYFLTLRAKIKNYDHQIENFLNFMAPFCSHTGFIGYMRDETAENPTLIFIQNKKVFYRRILEYIDLTSVSS